jgi:hypothetical protein
MRRETKRAHACLSSVTAPSWELRSLFHPRIDLSVREASNFRASTSTREVQGQQDGPARRAGRLENVEPEKRALPQLQRPCCVRLKSNEIFHPPLEGGSKFIANEVSGKFRGGVMRCTIEASPLSEKSFATLRIFRPSLKGRVDFCFNELNYVDCRQLRKTK